MPILVQYDPAGGTDLLNLAAQAGTDTGRGQVRNQQRAIDARTSQMAIAAAQDRNSQPGFYERVSRNAAAEGRDAQMRQSAQENADREFRFAEDQAADQQAARAAEQGNAQRLAQEHARLLEDFQGDSTPEAAARYITETTRRGIKPNERVADFAGPLTPGEQTARQRAAATTTQQGATQELGRDRLSETQRHNRAMEENARSRSVRGTAPSATDQRRRDAEELAGWGGDALATVDAFMPGLDGKPSPAAVDAYRGIIHESKSPGQILARVKELEDAGLEPAVAGMMRKAVADRQVVMEQKRQEFTQRGRMAARSMATLPPTATAADVAGMLQQLGMTIDEYEVFLNNEEQEAGLAPAME